MNTIYSINELPYKDSNATALDNDFMEKYMCIGSPGCVSIVEGEKYTVTPRSAKTKRHAINLLRWQRFRDTSGSHIVSTSTQFFDIYGVGSDGLNLLGSTRAHPFNLTDIDWCTYDLNALLSCSIDDPVKFWDLRDLRRPCLQLQVVAGAEQAKWAPLTLNLLCTSHGTDLRLWDNRNGSLPLQTVSAHIHKISCLMWHPTIATCFLTAGLDGYIKNNGSEFASIPVPPYGQSTENGALSLWKTNNLDIVQVVKCEDDVLLDLCWQNFCIQGQTYSCLYSASRCGRLRRYNLPPSEDMPNQEAETSCTSWAGEAVENPFVFDEEMKDMKSVVRTTFENMISDSSLRNDHGSTLNHHSSERQGVEIIDNSLCLTVPRNFNESVEELFCVGQTCMENLIVDHVDKVHSTLTWNKDTSSRFRIKVALSLEERSESSTLVNMEIVGKENCLTAEEIEAITKKLAEEVVTIDLQNREPVLPAILEKLQEVITSLKVCTAQSVDIPRRPESAVHFCEGASVESGPHSITLDNLSAIVPKSTLSSPPLSNSYDHWIPSPRTCGARFNGSGFLVIFGRNELAMRRMQSSKGSFQEESLWLSAERIAMAKKGSLSKKFPFGFLGDGHEAIGTPRSLDDYKHELLLSSEDMHGHLQNFCAYEKCTSPLCHSISGTPVLTAGMTFLPQKSDVANSQTSSQRGMRTSNSLAMLGSTRSNSMQNVRLHRRRRTSGTNVLADDHHHLNDGAPVSVVVIYDVSVLMSVSKDLARKYRLLGDNALELCLWNRKAVEESGRKDLVKVWQIVELCVRLGKSSWRKHCTLDESKTLIGLELNSDSSDESMSEEDSLAVAVHPFGRTLINSILDYFAHINDYQTAAVVICILSLKIKRTFETAEDKVESPTPTRCTVHHGRSVSTCGDSPGPPAHNTVHANAKLGSSFRLLQQEKEKKNIANEQPQAVTIASKPARKLSALLQNAFSGHRSAQTPKLEQDSGSSSGHLTPDTSMVTLTSTEQQHITRTPSPKNTENKFCSLLDPAYNDRFDEVRHQYADLLFRWRMYSKAAEVMKYSERAPYSAPLRVRSACPHCKDAVLRFKCSKCSAHWKFRCSLCQLPVLGILTVCALCGHGGHSEHMVMWFRENDYCALGCGCECKSACF